MGLTEGHWFENEDVPENYERALEDAVYNSCINANKAGCTAIDDVIKDLETAKRILISPFSLNISMQITVVQAIMKATELLEKLKARENDSCEV